MKRVLVLVALACALAPIASAGNLFEDFAERCASTNLPPDVCALALSIGGSLDRPGVSVGDFRGDPEVEIEIQDFYFSPHVSIIRPTQEVTWSNANPPGGNRHSVSSSDVGSASPVLPVPGFAFGGGKAFRSPTTIAPGESFTFDLEIEEMDPAGYLVLFNGVVVVQYHCYVHGASQMSGTLLVAPQ